jgi:type IV pilus assembly protein PilC
MNKKIKKIDVVIFTRNLSTMISAGIPLINAIDVIEKEQENIRMKKILSTVKIDLSQGHSFANCLSKHTSTFDPLFCHLVRSAEKSGTLNIMLKRIAHYLEKSESLKKKIKQALTYPATLLALTILVCTILMVFIVPEFEKLFTSFGAKLPLLTRFIISLSALCQQYGWILLVGPTICLYAIKSTRKRSPSFTRFLDRNVLKIVLFGELFQKAIIARISRTLATQLAAGIPLVDALAGVSNIANNSVFKNALIEIRRKVTTGQPLHSAMNESRVFPSMVIQMIDVGEHCGAVEAMLDKVATYYEEDVDHIVDSLRDLMEPFVMLILGSIVGGFVLAMYMPIFKLGSVF